ncbi:MAG: ribosome maturation factor RimM, partial [Caldilineae bacterium]
MPIPEGHMIVGRIINAHGLRGEVQVELHTDFPERFASGEHVLLGESLTLTEIRTSRPHKGRMLVLFE